MSALTAQDIAVVARGAGFRGEALARAVAVALAESGGKVRAVGVNSDRWRSRDRGLWQINDHWHPEVSDAEAFNPRTAARHAYRISSGGRDWSPWATWPARARLQMGRARLAAATVDGPTGGERPRARNAGSGLLPNVPPILPDDPREFVEGVGSVLDAWKQSLAIVIHAAAWVSDPHNWARVAMVTGGTAAVLVGVKLLAESGAAGSTAKSIADIPEKVMPIAKDLAATAVTKGAGKAGKVAK